MMPIPASAAWRSTAPLFDTIRLTIGTFSSSSSHCTGQWWRSCSKAKLRQSWLEMSDGWAGVPRRAR